MFREDAHTVKVAITDTEPFKGWSFFAVFDGHAGSRVAQHSSENLLQYLLDTSQFKDVRLCPISSSSKVLICFKLVKELETSNGTITDHAKQLITAGMKAAHLLLDEHMANEKGISGGDDEKEKSGTTAVSAILAPDHVFFGNLGDSRALLGRLNQELFYTIDHKPYLEAERDRIVKAGGTVIVQRVNGSLAVSRALGDYEYKSVPGLSAVDQLVSPGTRAHSKSFC